MKLNYLKTLSLAALLALSAGAVLAAGSHTTLAISTARRSMSIAAAHFTC